MQMKLHGHQSSVDLSMDGLMLRCHGWQGAAGSFVGEANAHNLWASLHVRRLFAVHGTIGISPSMDKSQCTS